MGRRLGDVDYYGGAASVGRLSGLPRAVGGVGAVRGHVGVYHRLSPLRPEDFVTEVP
jgi:hypothetical protein